MDKILLSSLMSKKVSCLSPNTPLKEAIALMAKNRFSCVVIKENNEALGIFTERDIIRLLSEQQTTDLLEKTMQEVMTAPVLSLNQNETLFDALVVSRAERIRHLPVTDDNDNLVGLVTQSDLTAAHFQVIELQSEMIEQGIAARTIDLESVNAELQTLSMEDHLMNIGNRRAMEVDLAHTHATALRYGNHYAALLIDVDHFKLYNDFYGHQKGDEALKDISQILKSSIRSSDRLYRYGGEELLLVLPNTSSEQSKTVADKVVNLVFNAAIPHEKSSHANLSISVGGAVSCLGGKIAVTWKELVAQADVALYKAKRSGRNQFHISQIG
ncbi:MAG: diguanylate cyclase (GGDEF)-like protein [Candidatus Azotimanducaceae bacterium]|jgi:diguanylate cyclase (GGDEF)-like protein